MPRTLERALSPQTMPTDARQRARSAEAKNNVRETLIRAGRELMAAAGEEPLSLRGIARHAGYSSGVIYRYFPDREALFDAIRDKEVDALVDTLEKSLSPDMSADHRLRLIADCSYNFCRQQINMFGMKSLFLARPGYLADNETLVAQHDLVPSAARVHRLYEAEIDNFVTSGTFAENELSLAVASFMAVVSGAVMLPAGSTHGDFPEGRRILHALLDSLLSSWANRPGLVGKSRV